MWLRPTPLSLWQWLVVSAGHHTPDQTAQNNFFYLVCLMICAIQTQKQRFNLISHGLAQCNKSPFFVSTFYPIFLTSFLCAAGDEIYLDGRSGKIQKVSSGSWETVWRTNICDLLTFYITTISIKLEQEVVLFTVLML